ncbi:unnamed protein product [Rotaria socialis]
MLDVTKRPSKHTDLAYQKYGKINLISSIRMLCIVLYGKLKLQLVRRYLLNSTNEYDSESKSQRSLLTANIKRKFIWNREQNEKLINNERESKSVYVFNFLMDQ